LTGGPGWFGYRYFVTKPDPKLRAQEVAALRKRIDALEQEIRDQGERSAMLERQCTVQKIELEWLYQWIPVNKLARKWLFGRNLGKRLMVRLHLRP
jgi:hypothetical protein